MKNRSTSTCYTRKEKVTDADDVKFEIWKAGDEKHEMLEGKHKGKGVYAVENVRDGWRIPYYRSHKCA